MHFEPEYRVDIVDAVFRADGCERVASADPEQFGWVRVDRGHTFVGSYVVGNRRRTIRESHLFAIGWHLGYRSAAEMGVLIEGIRQSGGEYLG